MTVTFSQAAAFPDVRILEYRGVTTLDVTAGASGNSAAANSGAATTTSANELIFGANTVFTRKRQREAASRRGSSPLKTEILQKTR